MSEEDCFHVIVTKIYNKDGELIKQSCAHVHGDYEYTEAEKQYFEWLDSRRNKHLTNRG